MHGRGKYRWKKGDINDGECSATLSNESFEGLEEKFCV
jgi:hypothetical protein